MATLELKYNDLRRYVGRFLGYDRDYSKIEANSKWKEDVDDVISSGLREFYFYRAAEGVEPGHIWSFMIKEATISVSTGDVQVAIPSDFSRMVDGFTYGAGAEKTSLASISQHEIKSLYSKSNASGDPVYYSIMASSGGSSHVASIYPKASADVTFYYRYAFEPSGISTSATTPLGGTMHAETILESCLAAAEKQMDPESGPGVHQKRFLECLIASLAADKAYNTAATESGAWPIDEVAGTISDLTITKAYIMRLIGRKMDYGENDAAWNHKQKSEILEVLRQGLRGFYSPVIAPGDKYAHQWSFLCPTYDMTFPADSNTFDLPEDFVMMDGPITYEPGNSVLYPSINIVGEATVRKLQQSDTCTGRPTLGAIRVKELTAAYGTEFELIVHPKTDESYTVHFPYRSNPMIVSKDSDLPFGGQPHAQTVIESCMYAADVFRGVTPSPHENIFMARLRASVSIDRETESSPHLGYNRDRSDNYSASRDWHDMDENIVTYYDSVGIAYST